jgi:hypothetical protein
MSSALPELQVRNSDPEQVALAVLDFCEHAARGATGGLDASEDGAFMAVSTLNYMSRVRTLKREAAAQWRSEFTKLIERCHSLTFQKVGSYAKEGVRPEKMRCMACGRQEKCCPYVLRMVGPFDFMDYTGEGSNLTRDDGRMKALEKVGNIRTFMEEYAEILQSRNSDPTPGVLPQWDMGDYAIGNTCFRKAILFYLTNTLLLEEAFSAFVKSSDAGVLDEAPSLNNTWVHATPVSALALLRKLDKLQLAIGNPRKAPPRLVTDDEMWTTVSQVRKAASSNDKVRLRLMLRARAAQLLNLGEASEADLCAEVDSESDDGSWEAGCEAEWGAECEAECEAEWEAECEAEWEAEWEAECEAEGPRNEFRRRASATGWIVSDHEEEDGHSERAGGVDDDEDSSEEECRIRGNRHGRGRRSVICESEDGDEIGQADNGSVRDGSHAQSGKGERRPRDPAPLPTRKSRRVQSLAPEIIRGIGDSPARGEPESETGSPVKRNERATRAAPSAGPGSSSRPARSSHRQSEGDACSLGEGPRNEGPRNEGPQTAITEASDSSIGGRSPCRLVRPCLRRAMPSARSLASVQRRPDGRLAARNQAMVDLSMLTTRLLQEGLDDYAAVCTQAVFVMQEQRDMLASAEF